MKLTWDVHIGDGRLDQEPASVAVACSASPMQAENDAAALKVGSEVLSRCGLIAHLPHNGMEHSWWRGCWCCKKLIWDV